LEEYGYLKGSLISEWFSRVSFEKIHLMVGALTTSDQYTVIYLKNDGGLIKVRVVCQFDEVELPVGEKLKTEKVVFMWDKKSCLENQFAKLVSKRMKLKNVVREISGICCAYYAQGNKVNEEYVMNTLYKIDEKKNAGHLVNTDTILIDAGYCEFGDWLNYKNQFPKGMKYIASEIRSRGFKAGIWIAPIIATINSQLYQTHKNWFIQGFEGRKTQPFDFIDSLSLMILDPTLSEVKDYLGKVYRQYYDWGFRVFKIDFVYPLGFTTDFSKNVTRAQALTGLLDVIKSSVGKDAVFLSAISQLSPLVGYIDFVRTGIDTTSPLSYAFPVFRGVVNNYMLKKNIESFKGRNFLNGKVWNADIDCLVLNQNTGLDKNLIIEQQILMNQSNSRWVGDDIGKADDNEFFYNLI
ncbi:MAG TPA: alpha-galactosidase, partial [Candidatus Woesebacteria bacterium]|nr:alpha-galactosidase [Candidatus Woesebacteria bacterium]